MDYNLTDRVAVVTGAGGAIGSEISRSLCAEGARVAIWDISLDAARKTAEEITGAGGTAIGVECDVLSKEKVAAALDEPVGQFGTVDVLVNGARAAFGDLDVGAFETSVRGALADAGVA